MSAAGTTGLPSAGTIRLPDLLGAELTKICTLPACRMALAAAFVANTVLGAFAATDAVRLAGKEGQVPVSQVGILMLAPAYVFVAITVFAAGSEYRGGQLRVSLAAVPDRTRLFAAKLVAATLVSLLAAVAAILPGHLVQHAAAITRGGPAAGGAVLDLAALVGAHLLLGLIGFGFAVITRSVLTPLAVLAGTPVLISPRLQGSLPDLVRLLPHEATLSLLDMAGEQSTALDRTGGLLVLVVWTGLFVGSAGAVVTRRDS